MVLGHVATHEISWTLIRQQSTQGGLFETTAELQVGPPPPNSPDHNTQTLPGCDTAVDRDSPFFSTTTLTHRKGHGHPQISNTTCFCLFFCLPTRGSQQRFFNSIEVLKRLPDNVAKVIFNMNLLHMVWNSSSSSSSPHSSS